MSPQNNITSNFWKYGFTVAAILINCTILAAQADPKLLSKPYSMHILHNSTEKLCNCLTVQPINYKKGINKKATMENHCDYKMCEKVLNERTMSDEEPMVLQNQDVLRIIAHNGVPSWDHFPIDAIDLQVISGGLSNRLYKATLMKDRYKPLNKISKSNMYQIPFASKSPSISAVSIKDFNSNGEYTPDDSIKSVLIRLYGNHLEDNQRKLEHVMFKNLSDLGIAPKLISEFQGGRIEKYIESRTLLRSDIEKSHVAISIVNAIANFHMVDHSAFGMAVQPGKSICGLNEADMCSGELCSLCRLNLWSTKGWEVKQKAVSQIHDGIVKEKELSDEYHTLLKENKPTTGIKSALKDARTKLESYQKTLTFFNEMPLKRMDSIERPWLLSKMKEYHTSDSLYIVQLRQQLAATYEIHSGDDLQWLNGYSMTFSHNDVQENNVIQDLDGEYHLIDFEYSGFNIRAYDMGNLFCETTIDYWDNNAWPFYSIYTEKMPNEDARMKIVETYLSALATEKLPHIPTNLLVTKEIIRRFNRAVDYGMLLSHLVWSYWSCMKVVVPEDSTSFSHMEYGKARMRLYDEKKAELLKK